MKDIVFTLEFDDSLANDRANSYLEKGWTLLHVGSKTYDEYRGQPHNVIVYIVGANQEQYDEYTEEQNRPSKLDEFTRRFGGNV